jgi:hypothetical protein
MLQTLRLSYRDGLGELVNAVSVGLQPSWWSLSMEGSQVVVLQDVEDITSCGPCRWKDQGSCG